MQLADLRHDDLMRSIELFGREIIPAVQAAELAELPELDGATAVAGA
jgi:hypothetical protein